MQNNNFQNSQSNTNVEQFRGVGNKQENQDQSLTAQYQPDLQPKQEQKETERDNQLEKRIQALQDNQEKILAALSDFSNNIKDISEDTSHKEKSQLDPTNTQNVQTQTIKNQTSTPNPTQYVESNQTPTPETPQANGTPDPTNDPNTMSELAQRLGSNSTQNPQAEQTQQNQPQSVANQYNPQNEF
jgi:hypothetical protein